LPPHTQDAQTLKTLALGLHRRRGGDGVEQRIDLGVIGGRTFVNNASFGAYAEVVESPAYRDDKRGTTLQMLPDILSGHRGATLTAHAGDATITGPQALLVSNNPYQGATSPSSAARRGLDAGMLGVVAVTVNNALQATMLLRGARGRGLTTLTAKEVVVDADVPEIPVGGVADRTGRNFSLAGAAGQGCEQAQVAGQGNGLGAVVGAELGVQGTQVGLDGVDRDIQFAGDFRPGQVGGQVAQHPQLAGA
jgi:hypothetical protein